MNPLTLYFIIGFFCVLIYFGRVLNRTGLTEKRASEWNPWFRKNGLKFTLTSVGLFIFWLPYLIYQAVRMTVQGERRREVSANH